MGQNTGVTHLVRFPTHHVLVLNLLQTAGKHGVVSVDQLLSLLAGNLDVPCVGDHNVVTTIRYSRLVLSLTEIFSD